MTAVQRDRYLRLLGVAPADASRPLLDALVAAHLERVPFENLSKLYRLRRSALRDVPSLDEHLDGIEHLHLGGTCHANARHLRDLLETLGFDAALHGAEMSRPDVHAVLVVALGGRDLLVDPGYGGPFLAPMPLDLPDAHVVAYGRDRYVLHPRDGGGSSALQLHRRETVRQAYLVRPSPRQPPHFGDVVAESFRADAVFMNAVAIARFSRHRAQVLRNLSLLEIGGAGERRRALADRGELVAVAEALFGVPREVTESALAALTRLSDDAWA